MSFSRCKVHHAGCLAKNLISMLTIKLMTPPCHFFGQLFVLHHHFLLHVSPLVLQVTTHGVCSSQKKKPNKTALASPVSLFPWLPFMKHANVSYLDYILTFFRVRHKRVFETVKNINQSVRQRSPAPPSANIPGSNQTLSSLRSTLSGSNTDNLGALDNREQSMLLEAESTDPRWVGLNTDLYKY